MKNIFILSSSLLLIISIFACNSSKKHLQNLPHEKMDTIYNVEVGDVFDITLKSNPSTGFKWEITETSDNKILSFQDRKFVSNSSDKNLIGAGGKMHWTYQAEKKGIVVMHFNYKRSETDKVTTKYVKVIVSEDATNEHSEE
ncbi:MAG: protease inhibitor I42 family protein [Bacteroidota bacterium]|nr:protease inhibitor I42 family protein [Bacteroidota bacterium]